MSYCMRVYVKTTPGSSVIKFSKIAYYIQGECNKNIFTYTILSIESPFQPPPPLKKIESIKEHKPVKEKL